ncbi:MAG: hypothetical protein ACRD2J_11500 [Thermoanaerobaculia bacterium]
MRRHSLRTLFAAFALAFPTAAFAGGALSIVPPDAATVGVANIEQFRNSPLAGKLFAQADKMSVDGEGARFLEETGLDPAKDVDVVTFALTPKDGDPTKGEPLIVFEGRFDAQRLAAALAKRGAMAQPASGATYYLIPDSDDDGEGAVAPVNDSLILAGAEGAVVEALAYLRDGGSSFTSAGALAPQLDRVDGSASAWLLVDVARTTRMKNEPDWQGDHDHPGQALLQSAKKISTVALWTSDRGDELAFGVTAVSSDAETRQLLEDTARGMLAMWRLAAQEKNPELVDAIREFSVTNRADGVTLQGSIRGETLRDFMKRHQKEL